MRPYKVELYNICRNDNIYLCDVISIHRSMWVLHVVDPEPSYMLKKSCEVPLASSCLTQPQTRPLTVVHYVRRTRTYIVPCYRCEIYLVLLLYTAFRCCCVCTINTVRSICSTVVAAWKRKCGAGVLHPHHATPLDLYIAEEENTTERVYDAIIVEPPRTMIGTTEKLPQWNKGAVWINRSIVCLRHQYEYEETEYIFRCMTSCDGGHRKKGFVRPSRHLVVCKNTLSLSLSCGRP